MGERKGFEKNALEPLRGSPWREQGCTIPKVQLVVTATNQSLSFRLLLLISTVHREKVERVCVCSVVIGRITLKLEVMAELPYKTGNSPDNIGGTQYELSNQPEFSDGTEQRNVTSWIIPVLHNIQHNKIFHITICHWLLLFIWIAILLAWTRIYRSFFDWNRTLATVCTNFLLFGCSDIMAQCIQCFYLSRYTLRHPETIDTEGAEELLKTDLEMNGNKLPSSSVDSQSLRTAIPAVDFAPNSFLGNTKEPTRHHITFNWWRWFFFMVWGALVSTVQLPWFTFLNTYFGGTETRSIKQAVERMLADQIVYSPLSIFAFFVYSNFVMEGGNMETVKAKIKNVFLQTLGCNYIVWPFVQLCTFSVVPDYLQVPFVSIVGILWNCFLSMKNAASSTDL